MKTNIFTIIFSLFIALSASSQSYWSVLYYFKNGQKTGPSSWFNDDYSESIEGLQTAKDRKELGVKQVNLTRTYKGKESTTSIECNAQGRLIHSKNDNFERTSTYLNDSLEINRVIVDHGKTSVLKRTYNEQGKMLLEENWEEGKLKTKIENTYNGNQISNAKLFYKGDHYEMKYEFNEDQTLTRSDFYKNNKLKQSWNYSCRPEGEALMASKNEMISSKCEFKDESADGSYAIYTRTIRNGNIQLIKETFSKDSIRLLQEIFHDDTILVSKVEYNQNETIHYSYRKGKVYGVRKDIYIPDLFTLEEYSYVKDKLRSLRVTQRDAQKNVLKITHYSGEKKKLNNSRDFAYDLNGNKVLEQYSSKANGEIDFKRTSDYFDNGTVKTSQFFLKGKLRSSAVYTYVY